MRQILVGLIAVIVLCIFFFGDSINGAVNKMRSGNFEFDFKPAVTFRMLFE